MSVTAAQVIALVRDQLQDPAITPVWSDATLWTYIDDAQLRFLSVKPALFSQRLRWVFLATGAGTATQPALAATNTVSLTLPSSVYELFDMLDTGTSVVTLTPLSRTTIRDLDANVPNWRTAAAGVPSHFVYSPDTDRDTYFLYPPPAVGTAVSVVAAVNPTLITASGTLMSVADAFMPAIVDYVCFRALMRDAEYAANDARSQSFYQLAMQSIGVEAMPPPKGA
jgi:hypothetical protein